MAKSNFDKFVDERLEEEKQAIIAQAADDYLANLPNYNITLNQFIKQMEADGLIEHVGEMTLTDIANLVNPPSVAGRKRMTKAEKEKLMERIPEYLSANSWSKKKDIALGIGADPKKLTGILRELVDGRKLKKTGEKGGTMYTVWGDKGKVE